MSTRIYVKGKRTPHSGRTVKRRKTAFIPGVGVVPASSIFPASARGKYRTGGNYGKYDRGSRSELKFIDNILTANVISATGEGRGDTNDFVTPAVAIAANNTLVQIAQGDQAYQRNGKTVRVKAIHGRLTVQLPSTTNAASTADIYRVMLVLDTQCNGAVFNPADLISYPGQAVSVNSFNNLENNHRFRVLMDVERPINSSAGGAPTGTPAFGVSNHLIRFSKKCDIPIEYSTSATTGAIATIKSNNLVLFTISANGLVSLGGIIRLRFTD